MSQKASYLIENYTSGAPANSVAVYYQGGRGVLVTEATTYPTTCVLQAQVKSGKWIDISANITADGFQSLDLPAGQYRMRMAGGAAAALYASLVSVPYI